MSSVAKMAKSSVRYSLFINKIFALNEMFQWNVPTKCFKICYILCTYKKTHVVFLIFLFVQLYIFTLWKHIWNISLGANLLFMKSEYLTDDFAIFATELMKLQKSTFFANSRRENFHSLYEGCPKSSLVLARAQDFNTRTCPVLGILMLDPSLKERMWRSIIFQNTSYIYGSFSLNQIHR